MFGRKKLDPYEQPPYDYAKERRLIEEGDLVGLRKHMGGRPYNGIMDALWVVVPAIVTAAFNERERLNGG